MTLSDIIIMYNWISSWIHKKLLGLKTVWFYQVQFAHLTIDSIMSLTRLAARLTIEDDNCMKQVLIIIFIYQ